MTRLAIAVVVMALGVFASSRAEAQLTPEMSQTLMNGAILKNSRIPAIAGAYDAKQGKPAAVKPGTTRSPLTATDFKRDARKLTVTAFTGNNQIDPQIRDVLQMAYDQMSAKLAKTFRKDNLATAMGFAMVGALEVSSGNEMTDDQAKEIILNVNDIMVAAPEIKKMTTAQIQDLHDRLIMSTTVMLVFYAMQDPKMKALGQSLAKDFLAQIAADKK